MHDYFEIIAMGASMERRSRRVQPENEDWEAV